MTETSPEVVWAGGAFLLPEDPHATGMIDDEGRLTEKGAAALVAALPRVTPEAVRGE